MEKPAGLSKYSSIDLPKRDRIIFISRASYCRRWFLHSSTQW